MNAAAGDSPFPLWCDVRILHVAIPDGLASVTVRYVIAAARGEGGGSWMGECDVWVCEVGAGDGYDWSTHYERTTKGHELPQSLHHMMEEAAEEAWRAHLDGQRALDQHNRDLSSAYLAWREHDAEIDAFTLVMTETAGLAGLR